MAVFIVRIVTQARMQDFLKGGDKISHEHIFYFNYGQKSYYNKLRKK